MGEIFHLRDYRFEKENPDGKEMLLDTAIRMSVAEALETAGFRLTQFTVNEKSLEDYFAGPIINSEMDETTIGPYYDYITEDAIHRVETRLEWDDPENPDEFTVDTLLLRLLDYRNGNHKWQAFNYVTKEWTIGPGEGFYPLEDFKL